MQKWPKFIKSGLRESIRRGPVRRTLHWTSYPPYDAHVVPESRLVGHGPLSKAGSVDFKAQRKPLLLIAGSEDHIIPAKLNRANLAAYAGSPSVTEFKEFEGRTHGLLAQAGWEEIADYALNWARAHR